ncbi:hypothetical protein JTB14_028965 [Gonioctena quinquepunctata]|nr:hypothetical protein JTB14_028965 [Gonioctena quinquepunctata]
MSPELAAKEEAIREGKLKVKENEPCHCGGYEAATEALVGRELYTKNVHNKLMKQLNAAALESESTKQCQCGGTGEDHAYLTDINDITIKVKCIGSIPQTEAKTGRELTSNSDMLKVEGDIERSVKDKFQSYYEEELRDREIDPTHADTIKGQQPAVIEMEENMEKNGEKASPEEKSEYQAIVERDMKIQELEKEKDKIEKKKRGKIKNLRKNEGETPETEVKPGRGKSRKFLSKKETCKQIQRIQQKSEYEKLTEIDRTPSKGRKYMNKDLREKTEQSAQEELDNLKADIKREAQVWTQRTLNHLEKTHAIDKKEFIPFCILKVAEQQATYNYWLNKLTEENQNTMQHLTNRIKIITSNKGKREENPNPLPPSESSKKTHTR